MRELNFIFVGPQRTGTTWLYEHLMEHPDLCFPKDVKETMFFDRHFEKGMDWYLSYFSGCTSGQWCGEVAPTYFDDEDVPLRIKNQFPNCKVVISLRNPVERARSLYQYHYQKGRVKDSFSDAIKTKPDILTSGYYKTHLKRWFSSFDEEQILVISLEDIKANPNFLLKKLCDFLEVDKDKLSDQPVERERSNPIQSPRFYSLTKIGMQLVNKLHSLRLHWIVNIAKKAGLKNLLFAKNGEKPGLTSEEEKFLRAEYAPHIEFVNSKFENISL